MAKSATFVGRETTEHARAQGRAEERRRLVFLKDHAAPIIYGSRDFLAVWRSYVVLPR